MSKASMTRLRILVSGLPTKAAGPVGHEVLRWLQENAPEAGDPLHQKLRWAAYHRVRVAVEEVLDVMRSELAQGLDDYMQKDEDDDRAEVCGECGGPVGDTEYKPFCSRACQEAWQVKAEAFKREGQG
jgi:hypothetical protein